MSTKGLCAPQRETGPSRSARLFRRGRRTLQLAGSEMVILTLKQDVEGGERSVAARDILLQVELVRFAQFVAGVNLLLENPEIIPNHYDFVEEGLERNLFGLK